MEKKYELTEERRDTVSEPTVACDAMVEMRERAIESIRQIKSQERLQAVLDFMKQQEENEAAKRRDLERSISLEEFREGCYQMIDEIYGKGNLS